MGFNKSKKSNLTKEEFNKKLKKYKITKTEFAHLIGYHPQSVKQWGDGDIPYFIEIIFDYFDILNNAFERIEERKTWKFVKKN